VIEIGPGRGALTEQLAARAGRMGRVVAVEVDRALTLALRERYAPPSTVTVVTADVLETDLFALARGPFLLTGNVPYHITTPILFHALRPPRADRMVFLVQREVAERACARPGLGDYGALSVNLQAVATCENLFRVAAGAFSPRPRVESAVLRIVPRAAPVVTPDEEPAFRAMVQGLFGFRRKRLLRGLRSLWSLDARAADALARDAAVDPDARPETLTPADFARVLRARSNL
jgi:16S rRNA (adenine1518-N6/adenine1519-N6)-dimethyltransferase